MVTDTDKPTIKAIAPWFGGKRTMAPRIVAELGEHRSYWEPFCGGLSIIMVKPPCRMETVNDLNGDIINLTRCVADPTIGPQLYRRLRRIIFHETYLKYSADYINCAPPQESPMDAQRAMHYFICCWMGISGLMGVEGYKMRLARRYTNKGGHAATRWNGEKVTVTTFAKDGSHLVACSYHPQTEQDPYANKIKHRYKITIKNIREKRAARRAD